MDKKKDLYQFLTQKISQVDSSMNKEIDDMARLKLATMRASYAKLMENFLKSEEQLPKSYLQQAKIYLKNGKIEQAISQAQLAKRKISQMEKDQRIIHVLEDIDLLLVECYHKSKKSDDALSIIEEIQITSDQNKEKYLGLKGKIYQGFHNEAKSRENYEKLHELVTKKYGKNSLEDGLCLVEMGKNIGYFKNQQEGIKMMNDGMEILINHRYHNPDHVAQIYETLAEFSKEIDDFEKEYSSLICAHSMIKQLQQNQEKRSIEVLTKLASNLIKREEKQKALEFLIQVEQIQRKIYGQSSTSLIKTVKKIIAILTELNRLSEVRKYQNEYEHLLGGSRINPNKTVTHVYNYGNTLNNSITQNNMTAPSSFPRQKLTLSSNSGLGHGSISRVVM